GHVAVVVPAGTLAGTSFALDLGAQEGAATRLRQVATALPPPAGTAADAWALVALLGNLAKLFWVIGWERDHLRRHLERVQEQRQLEHATGASLDLLGFDLGVPRFPPRPYSFDAQTIALYHLDEAPGDLGVIDT